MEVTPSLLPPEVHPVLTPNCRGCSGRDPRPGFRREPSGVEPEALRSTTLRGRRANRRPAPDRALHDCQPVERRPCSLIRCDLLPRLGQASVRTSLTSYEVASSSGALHDRRRLLDHDPLVGVEEMMHVVIVGDHVRELTEPGSARLAHPVYTPAHQAMPDDRQLFPYSQMRSHGPAGAAGSHAQARGGGQSATLQGVHDQEGIGV